MELTKTEENKNRIISATITSAIFGLLLLFLILFHIITPNPPFPESGGGGGQELALGMMNLGNDNIDYGSLGSVTDVIAENSKTEDDIVTDQINILKERGFVKEGDVVVNTGSTPIAEHLPTNVIKLTTVK